MFLKCSYNVGYELIQYPGLFNFFYRTLSRKGWLVGVIGKVGSGKSSLLSAILAEMRKQSGDVYAASVSQGFGLAAQEAWIQHATIRNNILFGKKFDRQRYEAVIGACALTEDLQV